MRARSGGFLALALLATALAYRSLPSVYFVGDDFLHLFLVVDADRYEYLLRPHGGHLLLTRNALFVAFHELFGMNAAPYYTAALLTHLVNAALLFRVVMNWTASAPVAALGAVLWGTCPVHAGTLGWYSVYGQAVVATLLLVILERGSRSERDLSPLPWSIVLVWPLLLIIASTCFGVGIGILLAAPLAFLFLFPLSRAQLVTCAVLLVIALITPRAYRALITYHAELVRSGGDVWKMYMAFGMLQYRGAILTMLGYLFCAGVTNLLLGFGPVAAKFPSVASVCLIALFAIVVAAGTWRASARVRARLVGLLLLAGGCYGIIAAGRATMLPVLRLAASASLQRYHYVGMIFLALIFCCCVALLTERLRRPAAAQLAVLALALVLNGLFYLRAEPFIDLHDAARREAAQVVADIRSRVAEPSPDNEVRIINRRFVSVGALLGNPRSGFPGWAGVFVLFFPSNVVDGKRVQFVVDPELMSALAIGKRTRDLFVGGDVTEPKAPAINRSVL